MRQKDLDDLAIDRDYTNPVDFHNRTASGIPLYTPHKRQQGNLQRVLSWQGLPQHGRRKLRGQSAMLFHCLLR